MYGLGSILLAAIALARSAQRATRAFASVLHDGEFSRYFALALVPFPDGEVSSMRSIRRSRWPATAAAGGGSHASCCAIEPNRRGLTRLRPSGPRARVERSLRSALGRDPRPLRYAAGTLVQAGPGIPAWNYGALRSAGGSGRPRSITSLCRARPWRWPCGLAGVSRWCGA